MRNIKVYMQHLTIFGSFWRPSYAFILASVTELWADEGLCRIPSAKRMQDEQPKLIMDG